MTTVLVTGGTGLLGGEVVARLAGHGHEVRVLTHRVPGSGGPEEGAAVHHFRGNLADGTGLDQALAGVETVVHCATSFRQLEQVDVAGTGRLVEGLRAQGRGHLVYVSIVGVDRIPMSYYRAKRRAEQLLEDSGISWTIQRATQFHQLLDGLLRRLSWSPVLVVPRGLRFQPVAPVDLADRLVALVEAGPSGWAPDFGGPEVHTADELARSWLRAHGRRRPVVPGPLPGKLGRSFASGANLAVDHADGRQTWAQFLAGPSTGRSGGV